MGDGGFFEKLPIFDPTDVQTYDALCHCGTVRYRVTLSPPLPRQPVVECSCSFCSRSGYLLVYPRRENVVVTSGEEALRSYSFGRKQNVHKFCGRCGSSVFFDPRIPEISPGEDFPDILGVNIRMFKGIKVNEIKTVFFDGYHQMPFLGESDHLH